MRRSRLTVSIEHYHHRLHHHYYLNWWKWNEDYCYYYWKQVWIDTRRRKEKESMNIQLGCCFILGMLIMMMNLFSMVSPNRI